MSTVTLYNDPRLLLALLASTLLSGLLWIAAPAAATSLPPRQVCTDIPDHVQCIDQFDGLIHGAEITTPSYTLTCRAFRQLWLKRYWGRKSRAETREVVVAGVCDQRDLEGNLIRSWNTAEPFKLRRIDPKRWASTEAELPAPIITLISSVSGRRSNRIFEGYYVPEGWDLTTQTDPTLKPGFEPFPPLGKTQAWTEEPAGSVSIESPLFDKAANCSDGFVVCTPYLKILHPDPESNEIQVEMVSARRFFAFRTRKAKVYEHDATFLRESFNAP